MKLKHIIAASVLTLAAAGGLAGLARIKRPPRPIRIVSWRLILLRRLILP